MSRSNRTGWQEANLHLSNVNADEHVEQSGVNEDSFLTLGSRDSGIILDAGNPAKRGRSQSKTSCRIEAKVREQAFHPSSPQSSARGGCHDFTEFIDSALTRLADAVFESMNSTCAMDSTCYDWVNVPAVRRSRCNIFTPHE